MQLFSADAMVFSKKKLKYFFDPEKVKKRASKVAHNRPRPFYFTVQPRPTAHSPELIFHIVKSWDQTSVLLSVVQTYKYISLRIVYKFSNQILLSIITDMKLIVSGIFFVACLFNNLEVESSAQNYVRSPSGWILAPKSIPVKPRPQLSGIERFYGTPGTRGCPRRK